MKRGDLLTIALSDDYGKPRPALVIQSDLFDAHPSITVLPVTSELREAPLFRVRVEPTDGNGLRKTSEVMVDKTQTVALEKIGKWILVRLLAPLLLPFLDSSARSRDR